MGKNLLRGIGPRTFISYSFADSLLAGRIKDFLTSRGFQVRMEDETSLINSRLPDVLPQRVADCECFVQLRTEKSNKSYWVNAEFDLAEQRHAEDPDFCLIPVVQDTNSLADKIRQWVYVDATQGLAPEVLTIIANAGSKSIRAVRVDPSAPTRLITSDVLGLLHDQSDRRVVFDADGYWLDVIDSLIEWGGTSPDGERRQLLIDQEQRMKLALDRILLGVDPAVAVLVKELRKRAKSNVIEPEWFTPALSFFYRLLLARFLSPTFYIASGTPAVSWNASIINDLAGGRQISWGDESREEFAMWTMQPITNTQSFKATKVLGMVRTGLDAKPPKGPAYIWLPKIAIGSDFAELLRAGSPPEAVIMEAYWAVFGLPQVAARAVKSQKLPDVIPWNDRLQEIETAYGWKLDDYYAIGLP